MFGKCETKRNLLFFHTIQSLFFAFRLIEDDAIMLRCHSLHRNMMTMYPSMCHKEGYVDLKRKNVRWLSIYVKIVYGLIFYSIYDCILYGLVDILPKSTIIKHDPFHKNTHPCLHYKSGEERFETSRQHFKLKIPKKSI